MGITYLIDNKEFIFFKWELVVAGTIAVNMITQILKKTFKNWYGSLIAIISSILVSSTYVMYYVIYKLDLNKLKGYEVSYTLKMIFEYLILTGLLIICCKVGYDTLKCYVEKIKEIFSDTTNDKNI